MEPRVVVGRDVENMTTTDSGSPKIGTSP